MPTAPVAAVSAPPLKALSVRQPFAEWIVSGRKTVEYRSWQTHHRGAVLLHASNKPLALRVDDAGQPVPAVPLGAIVGTAVLIDCQGEPGDYDWLLANARRLAAPIPCKGALGLWKPPPAVLAAVLGEGDIVLPPVTYAAPRPRREARAPKPPAPLPAVPPPRGCQWQHCPRCGRVLAVRVGAEAVACEHCACRFVASVPPLVPA